MEALAFAVNDNERMIMKERAQQFPPPYAIAQEEKKTMVATSVMPSDGGEDQTGPLSVIRRDRGPREQTTQVERKVGTWEEMKTTITVGGELLTSAMEGEEPEEERKPPNTLMGDDPASMMANLADEVGERQRQVKDTETSALVDEDEHQGVDGGEAGVVRLVQGEDELLKGGHEAVGLGGGNRAENKRNAAPSLAPRLEGKRNRNVVPVTWDGAAIAATNIVSQPRNRERTRPSNFRSGAFLVTIPVPYREATASGRFNESRFADIDKHLKLGAIVERHVSEKPPGEPLVPTSPARDGDLQCR
eukprot:g49178.t1